MNVTLTPKKVYDLTINGLLFKDMRVTGELEGILQIANDTSKATLCSKQSELVVSINNMLGADYSDKWQIIRASPDILEATLTAQKESKLVTGTGSAEAKAQLAARSGTFTAVGEMP